MKIYDTIWVLGTKDRSGKFRGMHKVYDERFYKSAGEAFDALQLIDEDVRSSFHVFEIPIEIAVELHKPSEEGLSYR